jgi:branched-chain amino acid transport system ATP-binding protein
MTLLRIRGIEKRFGGLPAVDRVDLDVAAGQVVAVIGPNGAGKSTLLQLVAGLVPPTAVEELSFDGTDLRGMPAHTVRHAGIATVLQTPRAFASMTVVDNVAMGRLFGSGTGGVGAPAAQLAAGDTLALVGLDHRSAARVGQLTPHERRLLDLARALCGRPRLLLLDEVMAGLHPGELTAFVELIREVRAELDLTIVWVEHVMAAVRALADHAVVLHLGRRLADGTPDEVLRDRRVIEAYLGTRGQQAC